MSIELSEYCDNNGIILYELPPNSTHIMQPADVYKVLNHCKLESTNVEEVDSILEKLEDYEKKFRGSSNSNDENAKKQQKIESIYEYEVNEQGFLLQSAVHNENEIIHVEEHLEPQNENLELEEKSDNKLLENHFNLNKLLDKHLRYPKVENQKDKEVDLQQV
ncbi:hypothetical protein ABEB36_015600 [Hypothenemus hampei]|uniref:Uncharacterized protein n=1 Tax=Hypothenemus hampei TaxID=57062 RepID=A0ABD1E095_HYPHA